MADTDKSEWVLLDTDLTTRLAILPAMQGHLYQEFQEPGSGDVRIPLDSGAAALVSSGMFCMCYYRGAARGGFFVDNLKEVEADDNEGSGRQLSISGRGPLAILEDAIVWQDGSGATVRAFTGQTKAAILKTLIDEAVARGGLAELDYDFDATTSSDSQAWTDSEDYDINVGRPLLDVLRLFAKTGEIEFGVTIQAGAQPILLSAYKNGIGTDKSDSIYFRIGSNCEEIGRDERGDEIKNAILVKYKDGYVQVSDPTSIANRRRREQLLSLEAAQSGDSATTYASAQLDSQKDPKASITVKVFDGVSPYLFLDYILGDTVTVDRFGEENTRRILGIQANFEGDRPSDVVVEMDTIFYDNELRTRSDLDDILNRWNTARDNNLGEVREWLSIGSPDGPVYALHYYNGYLYVGGDFDNITGRLTTSNVARYNTATGAWGAMASGIADPVTAIVEHGGDIYAATSDKVYHYTGGAWSLIGTTVGSIKTMASFGSNLYVGGSGMKFDTGTDFCRVVYWDGSAPWNVSNSGLGTPNCLALAVYNGDLYGGFDTSLNTALRRLNGGAWSTVMAAPTDSTRVKALVQVGDDLVYTGSGKVYRWDGVSSTREDLFAVATWADPGGNTHDALAAYLSDVYLGSVFTSVDGASGYGNIVKYSGGIFNDLLDGVSTSVGHRINALAAVGSDVYAGGTFTTAGGKAITNLGVWVTSFRSLVQHLTNGASFDMGAAIHAATASAVTDNDEFPFWEDTAQALRKITWANIKSTLITLFDALYAAIVHTHDADEVNIADVGGYFTGTDVEAALQELGAGGGGGGSAHVIKDEGTPLIARAGLNFVGGGVTATDDAGNNETDVTIPDIAAEINAATEKLILHANDEFGIADYSASYVKKKVLWDTIRSEMYGFLSSLFADVSHSHDHNTLTNIPAAETQTEVILRYDNAATSQFTATINGAPAGAAVTYNAPSVGNENVIKPFTSAQLAKMRLYNTTRGNYALISDVNTTTNVITLTATAPVNWANGDTITITSQTVSIGTGTYVDFEITSGPTGKNALFVSVAFQDTTTAGTVLRLHPFEAGADGKVQASVTQVAARSMFSMHLLKITGNVFTIAWTASGSNTAILSMREIGFL